MVNVGGGRGHVVPTQCRPEMDGSCIDESYRLSHVWKAEGGSGGGGGGEAVAVEGGGGGGGGGEDEGRDGGSAECLIL